ncbi:MAG TPA: hypothetical protein VEQ87_10880 [Burkholderiales bacterium]|nr:hypothetical protein [Burkholderiales bacterium]
MRPALLALAVLLILGALAALGVALFHFWMSSGPPIPQPKDVFFERAWIDLAASAMFAIGASAALWVRANRRATA